MTTQWPLVSLNDLSLAIDYGHTASASNDPSGPKFLRITDLRDEGVDWAQVPFCSCSASAELETQLQPGDIVFARTGATTGKSHLIKECPNRAIFASYLIRVRLSNEADPNYVAHFFRTPDYWSQISQSSTGTAQPGVNSTNLRRLRIPIPRLDEQRRIAAILDQADALRAKRQRSSMLLKKALHAIFDNLFGDLVKNANHWPHGNLVELCSDPTDIRCGPFGTQLGREEFVSTGVPLWGIKHVNSQFASLTTEFVTKRKADALKQYTLLEGDLVMTRKGTIGNCAIYPQGLPVGIMHSDLLRIRMDSRRVNPRFLCHQLQYSRNVAGQISLISGGAVMAGINVTKLKNLVVCLPPLELQHQFDAIFEKQQCLAVSQKASLQYLNRLQASLQHRAFHGEL